METVDKRSRLIEIEPLEGESLSHFLGRFRRANYLTTTGLGKLTGLGAVISRWEKLLLNPFPTWQELEALANVVGIDVERLGEMLPPKGVGIKHRPILLCAACYGEFPWHRIEWQFKDRLGCVGDSRGVSHRHHLRLLAVCTNCETPFPVPANWVQGECQHCFLPFTTMAKRQKLV